MIDLPMNQEEPADIIGPFERHEGILTIFSKYLKTIDIETPEGPVESCSWEPSNILQQDDLAIDFGSFDSCDEGGKGSDYGLYFQSRHGGVLAQLSPTGFVRLPETIPAIWVVSPTEEREGIGFAVNGQFDLDAGRARLSGSSKVNEVKAEKIGKAFGRTLCAFFDRTIEDWEQFSNDIGIEKDLPLYAFWHSAWVLLTGDIIMKNI